MRSERQVRRTRPKVIVSCQAREWESEAVGRGFSLSVAVTFSQVLRTLRDFAWPLSSRGVYTILSDEDILIDGLSDFNYCSAYGLGFSLSVAVTFSQVLRTLRDFAWPLSSQGVYTILSDEDIVIGGLSDFNYCWHAVVDETGREYRWREARGSGAKPRWGPGAKPRRGAKGAEPPDCHETNLKCFITKFCREMRHDVKIRRQMTDYNEAIIKHIFKPKMTEIIKRSLKPKTTDCNETIIENIFKHLTSWVVFRTQWFIVQYCSEREGRGYRCRCTSVPLSLYFISISWLHSKDNRKGDGFFRFQRSTGAQVRFFFYSYNAFPHFFLLLVYGLAFPHFFTAQQVTKAAVLNIRVG